MTRTHPPHMRAAVCEVQLEQLDQGIGNLQGYQRALVVFRRRGSVVGQAWVAVTNGMITPTMLRACLPATAWAIWRMMAAAPTGHGRLPTASVVVCTRDRTADLALCLPELQKLAVQGHEVIVVDSCPSSDATARLVASYPRIHYIHEPRPGAGIARNRGLLAATRDVVAYTDDDAQVDPGWLNALLRNFDDPIVGIVTGITMPLELETYAQLWFEETHGFARGFERKTFDTATMNPLAAGLVGASVNMAVRRSALAEIGLFDEALGPGTPACSGEDHEYFYRTLTRGFRIVYDPTALVWHRHRREWDSLRRTIFGYGVGVFAWWTRALVVEHELLLLKLGPRWFWQHHVRQLVKALLRRPGHIPLDLAWAEFSGALAGPSRYFQSRRKKPALPLERPLRVPFEHMAGQRAEDAESFSTTPSMTEKAPVANRPTQRSAP
jgi:GT2 family glycosyltransferase